MRIRGALVRQKLGMILENKVVQKLKLEKHVFYKKRSPKLIFLKRKSLIFDIENWLWKYNFGTFWQTIIHWRIFKSMLILGQKSCFLGPTIFKIPQPNWHCLQSKPSLCKCPLTHGFLVKGYIRHHEVLHGHFPANLNTGPVHLCDECPKIYLKQRTLELHKVEKILKDSLDSIPPPSPSVKIQIMGGKVCLRCRGKTLLGVVNKLLKTKSLLTSPSNVLPYYLKWTLPPIFWIFTEGEGD